MNDTAAALPTTTPAALGHDECFRSTRLFLDAQDSDRHHGHNTFKRDACSDAFGSGWSDSTCAPGKALCCVNENQSYPQCQQYLGLRWCCTKYEQGCYADLTSTSCLVPGAVQCTELALGVNEACCPQYTTCASEYNASETFARCNTQQTVLQFIAASTTSLAGAQTLFASVSLQGIMSTTTSSTTDSTPSTPSISSAASSTPPMSTSSVVAISTSTQSSTHSSSTISSTPESAPVSATTTANPSTNSSGPKTVSLTVGAIAGIAIGPVLAVLLLLIGAWFFWRKRSKAKRAAAEPSPVEHQYHDHVYKNGEPRYASSGSDRTRFQGQRQEMGDDAALSEMADARTEAKELQTHRMLRGGASPAELDGGFR